METTARTATLSEPDPHRHGDYMAMEMTATPPGRAARPPRPRLTSPSDPAPDTPDTPVRCKEGRAHHARPRFLPLGEPGDVDVAWLAGGVARPPAAACSAASRRSSRHACSASRPWLIGEVCCAGSTQSSTSSKISGGGLVAAAASRRRRLSCWGRLQPAGPGPKQGKRLCQVLETR